MTGGTWALFDRALRRDALGLRAHVFRAAIAGVLFLMLLRAQWVSLFVGAPGLTFFGGLSWLNSVVVVLAGIVFFSSAVAEDKDEATLGLLQMAGISRLGLLLGKSTGHLLAGLMILAMQLPFTLLAVTLGGVTAHQILAMTAALAAALVFVANLGLFCSVISPRPSSAAVWTAVLWGVSVLIPLLADGARAAMPAVSAAAVAAVEGGAAPTGTPLPDVPFDDAPLWQQAIAVIARSSLLSRMGAILATNFAEPIVSAQVVTNVLAGGLLFLAAWWALETLPERKAAGWRWFSGRVPAAQIARRRVPTGAAAFRWKEFRLLTGGWGRLGMKLAVYGIVAAVVLLLTGPAGAALGDEPRALWLVGLMAAALTVEASWIASRLLHDEVREQTLSLLLLVPTPTKTFLRQKLLGAGASLVPAIVVLVVAAAIVPEGLYVLGSYAISPAVWSAAVYFLFVLHFTVLMSLTFEWWWVSLAIALGACFFSWPVWIALVSAGPGALCIVIPNTVATLLFVIWLQLGIIKAVEKAGER